MMAITQAKTGRFRKNLDNIRYLRYVENNPYNSSSPLRGRGLR
jgi:hypothetical protein